MERRDAHRVSIKVNGEDLSDRPEPSVRPPQREGAVRAPHSGTPPVFVPLVEDARKRLHQLREQMEWQGKASGSADDGLRQAGADAEDGGPALGDGGSDAPAPPFFHRGSRLARRFGRFARRGPVRIALSTASAVILGLLFGYAVLAVFQEEQVSRTYRTVLDGTVQAVTGADAPGAAGAQAELPGQTSPPTLDQSASLPELKLYVVQAGVFSTPEGAKPVVDALDREGFPHWLYESEGRQHVLVGAAFSRDDILAVANALTRKQLEAYVKQVTLPAGLPPLPASAGDAGQASSSDPRQVAAFLATGTELIKHLAGWSSNVLGAAQPDLSALAPMEAQVKQLHVRFLEESRAVEASAPEAWKEDLAGMADGLNRAAQALTQAKEANLSSHAWQVQAGVAAFLEHYAKWRGTAAP